MLNMDLTALADLTEIFEEMINTWESESSDLAPYLPDYLEMTETSLFQHYDFADVRDDDWFSAYVYHMANLEIMKGYNDSQFRPGQNITRAEFIKTIMAAYEAQYGDNPDRMIPLEGFSDIHSEDWFYSYVNQAKSLGMINGYNDGSFRPNQPITRAEAVSILIRSWEINNYFDESDTTPFPFKDISISDWYYDAIRKAYALNLVTGKTPETFAPSDYLSRAETATMISRLIFSNF